MKKTGKNRRVRLGGERQAPSYVAQPHYPPPVPASAQDGDMAYINAYNLPPVSVPVSAFDGTSGAGVEATRNGGVVGNSGEPADDDGRVVGNSGGAATDDIVNPPSDDGGKDGDVKSDK